MADVGFWSIATADPGRLAVVEPDGTEVSAGELHAGANRLVHALRALGLQRGDCIATVLDNGAAMLRAFLAAHQAGGQAARGRGDGAGGQGPAALGAGEAEGRVVGVRCERAGAPFFIKAARGVVLAIGGYDWNRKFARQHEQLPEWYSMCQPSVSGDNVVLGGEVGAALARVPSHNLGMFFGYRIPGEEHDGAPLYRASWEGGYPHAIWVNRAGRRFGDEAFYRDYLPKCRAWDGIKQEHPNYPPFLIFDQNYRDKYAFATYLPGMEVPEEVLPRAATPRALADKLGIDGAALEATIARFNQHATQAVDPDFNRGTYPWAAMMTGDRSRPNPNLGPLDKPPFYGLPLVPVGVGVNSVGLETNAFAQVMHVRGHAIPGLYACGNSAAALDIGAGYQSGLSNLRGMTWGYIAARHLTR